MARALNHERNDRWKGGWVNGRTEMLLALKKRCESVRVVLDWPEKRSVFS